MIARASKKRSNPYIIVRAKSLESVHHSKGESPES